MSFVLSLGVAHWLALALTAILVGSGRAGLDGGPLLAIPLMAGIFGARSSSSIMLGIMLTADLTAICKYRSQGSLSHLLRTLPFAAVGIVLGALIGSKMPENVFKSVVAVLILISAAMMLVQETRHGVFVLPERWYIAAPLGLMTGFMSMVGNAGGPILGLFLLSSGLLKNRLIGTTIWFLFFMNVFKLPFHIFVWHTLSTSTLLAGLFVAPLTIASVLGSAKLVQMIPEKPYRYFRLATVAIGGLYLLLV